MSGKFFLMNLQRVLLVLVAAFATASAASAQIIEERIIGNKTVTCMHSGLMSDLNDCGVRSDWYTYVFVGSISSVTQVKDDEMRVQIVPEEVFHGQPASPLTVLTSQAACLPDLVMGDRWLFFLRRVEGKPITLDYYGNDSRPITHAQEQIETLRRLKTIGDFAIVRGSVVKEHLSEGKAVPNARVVALRASDNAQFVATTGPDGRYEFQLLPPGEYKLMVDPVGLFQADESGVHANPGSCWSVTLSKSPHAELGGHVRHSDGSPIPGTDVIVMREDQTWFTTAKADNLGYFYSDSLQPGKYVVGINLPGAPPWKLGAGAGAGLEVPPASLYYPGVRNRSAALAIILANDQQREDIDFVISKE